MKKFILTVLSIIIMTSLISAAEISGTLFSHEGLCNKSCQKIKLIESRQTVYTDHQGKFTFRNVKPGRYTLIVYSDSKPEICEHILLKKRQKSCYSCFDIHGTGIKAQRYKHIKILKKMCSLLNESNGRLIDRKDGIAVDSQGNYQWSKAFIGDDQNICKFN